MKRLAQTIAILLAFSLPAQAQENFAFSLSAPNVSKLDLGRVQHNTRVCESRALQANCTQAAICVAAGVSGGASCTAPDALAAGVRIYANTQTGREAFIANELVKTAFAGFVQKHAQTALANFQAFCQSATPVQADGVCTASGLGAGCGICDAYK